MPVVKDPSKLTYIIQTPVGSFVATPDVRQAYNDLFRAWTELSKQTGPVMRRRLTRATFYRARLKKIVAL